MREGQLFEGYLFGFKEDKDEKELVGRKKPETIEFIKGHAQHVRPAFFREGELRGEAYKFISWEEERYIVRGECDFVGELDEDYLREVTLSATAKGLPRIGRCIADLKYTGDISRVWDFKEAKEDYMQSVFYPYIWWKNTGELLPFVYVVVDSRYATPIVRAIEMRVTVADFQNFVEPLLKKAATDRWFYAKPSEENCLGGYGQSQCWFLEYCEWGRQLIGGLRKFEFNSLYKLNK